MSSSYKLKIIAHAYCIGRSKSAPTQRPDRLISRLKNLNCDTSKPRMTVLRQPKGPDGSKGFKLQRTVSVSEADVVVEQ